MRFFSSLFHPPQRCPQRQRRRRGTALVETALCLTFVLLPLTLGGFQFALVFQTTHALQQVSREAGRYAAVHYSDVNFNASETQGDAPGSERSLKYIVRSVATAQGIPWNDIKNTIVVTPTTSQRVSGQSLTVSVTYPMRKRAILGSLFFKADENDPGSKLQPFSFGFLQNNYTASSTFLME